MDHLWGATIAEAKAGRRTADVVWIGDSLSVVLPGGHPPNWRHWEVSASRWQPLAWQIGSALSRHVERDQFRAGTTDPYVPGLISDGEEVDAADAGFGSRTLRLAPGRTARLRTGGEGASVMWTGAPGGGELSITFGGAPVGTISTDGPPGRSQVTPLRLPYRPGHPDAEQSELVIEARGAEALLEGVYVHGSNLAAGVRVWPAGRVGATSRDFVDHPGWALDAISALEPDLVVLATGTNDEAYGDDLADLIDAVAERRPGVPVAVWLPLVTGAFTWAEAEEGRRTAASRGAAVIDACGDLGEMPTVDGVHSTAVTVAVCAAHAAGALAGEPTGGLHGLAQAVQALSGGQVWEPGSGLLEVSSMAGEPALLARRDSGDGQPALGLIPEGGATAFMGLPGGGLSVGPGGDEVLDTHLSRVDAGHLAVNAGTGRLDLGNLHLASSPAVEAPSSGVVLHGTATGEGVDLAATSADGTTRLLTSDGAALRLPLPCALGLHRGIGTDLVVRPGDAVWVPAPALAERCIASHAWVEVVGGVGGSSASVTFAIVEAGSDGLPGRVLGTSRPEAIDATALGILGAELEGPVPIQAGRRWWVALLATGEGTSRLALQGAAGLVAGAPLHLGSGPVRPTSSDVDGSLWVSGASTIPAAPTVGSGLRGGAAPIVHVSLGAATD